MKKILICILAISMLSACGIKPSRVKSPAPGKDTYPQSYPHRTADDQ